MRRFLLLRAQDGQVTGEPSSSPSGPTRHPGIRGVRCCDFRPRERVSPRPQAHLLPVGWLVAGKALQTDLPQQRGLANLQPSVWQC